MNERIQELITAYLHKGSSPEQEKELFEACGRQPEIAEYLRKHLYLSLKLKQLQEGTEVPRELHNTVLRRVNELEAVSATATSAATSATSAATSAISASSRKLSPAQPIRRFGWGHILGSTFATAAAVFLLMFLLPQGEQGQQELAVSPVQHITDTMIVTRTDTVTQLREVSRPVYIVKYRTLPEGQRAENTAARVSSQMAVQTHAEDNTQATNRNADTVSENEKLLAETLPNSDVHAGNDIPSHRPITADIGNAQTFQTEREKNYLEQYNDMLIAVESVDLTSDDRIRY